MSCRPNVCLRLLIASAFVFLPLFPPAAHPETPAEIAAAPLSELTVGGGPSPSMNQAAIESNVRYVDSLLPKSVRRNVLFADGKKDSASVLYLDPAPALPPAEAAFRFVFGQAGDNRTEKLRVPRLPLLNGPARQTSVRAAFANLAARKDSRFLLYFTGHGEPGEDDTYENNLFDLWGDETLSVKELAGLIKTLPADRPAVVVMVQCYSGSFGNLLFERGDPAGKVIDRDLCGFFATTKDRVAAGCTPEVNEADYHDFTSSFFAALSGHDRLGHPVPSADYNGDGVVGMDEAFAYALLTEPSVDVPVATTDVFLRHALPETKDDDVARTLYSTILAAASPAQHVVLEGLSRTLNASGEDRLKMALAEVRRQYLPRAERLRAAARAQLEMTRLQRTWRRNLTERFPGLQDSRRSRRFADARTAAIAYLTEHPDDVAALAAAEAQETGAGDAQASQEVRDARWLRLMRVAKSVYLTTQLRASGNRALIERFEKLRTAEARNPLIIGQ